MQPQCSRATSREWRPKAAESASRAQPSPRRLSSPLARGKPSPHPHLTLTLTLTLTPTPTLSLTLTLTPTLTLTLTLARCAAWTARRRSSTISRAS